MNTWYLWLWSVTLWGPWKLRWWLPWEGATLVQLPMRLVSAPEPSSRAERLASAGGWADPWTPTEREAATATVWLTYSGSSLCTSEQANVFILLIILCSMVYEELSHTLSHLKTTLRSRWGRCFHLQRQKLRVQKGSFISSFNKYLLDVAVPAHEVGTCLGMYAYLNPTFCLLTCAMLFPSSHMSEININRNNMSEWARITQFCKF